MKESLNFVVLLGMVVGLMLGACVQEAPSFSPEVEHPTVSLK